MKIKKLILLAAVAGLVTACGNSSKKADSANSGEQAVDFVEILRNDSINKVQADSVAKADSIAKADAAFAEYQKSGVNITIGKFVVTKDMEHAMDVGSGYYTLTNNSDRDVEASDYTITVKDFIYQSMSEDPYEYSTVPGIAIKAHGTAKYKVDFTNHGQRELVKINAKPKTRKQFDAQYKPASSQAD